MQTESLLMANDRAFLRMWHRHESPDSTRWRIAHEIERLEQNGEHTISELADYKSDARTLRSLLDDSRAEVQRLRLEVEKDQVARDLWQKTIDAIEDENARLRNELRMVAHYEAAQEKLDEAARADAGQIGADLRSRIATLEGRIEGILEIVPLRFHALEKRVEKLEARQ